MSASPLAPIATTDAAQPRLVRAGRMLVVMAVVFAIGFATGIADLRPGATAYYDLSPSSVKSALIFCSAFALYLTIIFQVVRRHPIGPDLTPRGAAIHLVVCYTFFWQQYVQMAILGDATPAYYVERIASPLWSQLLRELVGYLIGALTLQGVDHFGRSARAESTRARLAAEEAELRRAEAEARLRAARAQLRSAGLIDALRGARERVHTDPGTADRALSDVGERLRALSFIHNDDAESFEAESSPEAGTPSIIARAVAWIRAAAGRLSVDWLLVGRIAASSAFLVVYEIRAWNWHVTKAEALHVPTFPTGWMTGVVHGALTLVMWHLARGLIQRHPWRTTFGFEAWNGRNVLIAFLVGAGPIAFISSTFLTVHNVAVGYRSLADYDGRLGMNVAFNSVTWGAEMLAITGVHQFIRMLRTSAWLALTRARRRRNVAERQRAITVAELAAIKRELNPHFIGNALNAASAIVRSDPAAALRLIDELETFLSRVELSASTQEVTLDDELGILAAYFRVEHERWPRVQVRWDVDTRALAGVVPHLVLQPLVENALKHGIGPKEGVGTIEVAASKKEGHLRIVVRDDGVGMSSERDATRDGIGVANVRERLARMYADRATFDLVPRRGGGTEAVVLIPWRTRHARSLAPLSS